MKHKIFLLCILALWGNAFNLTSGATVTSKSTSPTNIASDAFKNASNCTLAVGQGLQSIYSQKTGWNAFGTTVEDEVITPYLDGEVFTATTAEGIEMTFKVLSAANKTAQVGDGSNPAIDQSYDGDLVIPSQINGLNVTDIGNKAFYECKYLNSVNIQEGIIRLGTATGGMGRYARLGPFAYAQIANAIILPSTLTFIGTGSFEYGKLGEITIPTSVTTIDMCAFFLATIGKINIPYSETKIFCYSDKVSGANYTAFEFSTIGELNLNRLLQTDSYYNLAEFKDTKIEVLIEGPHASASYNCCTITDYYPKVAESLQQGSFFYSQYSTPTGGNSKCTNLHLPEGYITIEKVPYGTKTMNLPSTVTSISSNAGISLTQAIVLPIGLQTIGDDAITGANSVTVFAEYPIEINEAAFSSSVYQKTLYVPSGAKGRYEFATGWSKFANIVEIGDLGSPILFADEEVKRLCVQNYDINGDGELSEGEASMITNLNCFYTSKIISFNELGTYFTNLQSFSFSGCSSLTEITIPNSVTNIGNYAFEYCTGLASITIPNSVTSIGSSAFYGCSGLTSVTIPNSMTSIGNSAFYGCSGLTSITIPSSVTSIGEGVFYGCNGLTSVKVDKATPLSIGSYTFTNRADATLYVPYGSKAAYLAADYWKEFKEIIEFVDGDVNSDYETDVLDVVDIVRYVVGTPAETFVPILADINSDGNVNVADAVVLVNDIAGDQNFARSTAPRHVNVEETLTLTQLDDNSLSLSLQNDREYTAFQFDVIVPADVDITKMALNAQRKQKHQLLYNKVGEGHYRVAAISTSNRTFLNNSGELLNILPADMLSGDVTISNIHFFTPDGSDYTFADVSLSVVTGIQSLTSTPSPKGEMSVYTLDGRRVSVSSTSMLPTGMYIINGKKVVRM